jgi:hypothetical protein
MNKDAGIDKLLWQLMRPVVRCYPRRRDLLNVTEILATLCTAVDRTVNMHMMNRMKKQYGECPTITMNEAVFTTKLHKADRWYFYRYWYMKKYPEEMLPRNPTEHFDYERSPRMRPIPLRMNIPMPVFSKFPMPTFSWGRSIMISHAMMLANALLEPPLTMGKYRHR